MSPTKQAEKLIRQFKVYAHTVCDDSGQINELYLLDNAKQCAYICCDSHLHYEGGIEYPSIQSWKENNDYWHEVKNEVNTVYNEIKAKLL